MGKITAKHYVNKDLKPLGGLYPLYVQVIYNRKVYKFKSSNSIFEYASDELLEIDFTKAILNTEIQDIERTILALEKQRKDKITSKNISLYSKSIMKVFEENFCKLIKKEVPNAPNFFHTSSHSEIRDVIFFLNATLYDISEEIGTLHYIYQDMYKGLVRGKIDFLCIDFYNGEHFHEVQSYILSHFGEWEDEPHPQTAQVIQKFRELIEI